VKKHTYLANDRLEYTRLIFSKAGAAVVGVDDQGVGGGWRGYAERGLAVE